MSLAADAGAAADDSRTVVREIATLIENNYFDATKAGELGGELRRDLRSGVFDRFERPRDLARELTARLKNTDQHFNVIWLEGPSANQQTSNASSDTSRSTFGGQSYGFRTVSMLPGSIGYIDLRSFAYFSATKLDDPARAMADAALQLVGNASAVIIDLRSSIGGYAQMASYIVSAFTSPDADIFNVVHRRDEQESERPKQPYARPRTTTPLYVLVSGNTASAAESAAYTLQAAKRAIIIGERTSGAANPGGMFPVSNGFNVFISIGTPINPITKTNWEGTGVQPDVVVPSEQALGRAQRLALEALRVQHPAMSLEQQWALEALIAESTPPTNVPLGDYVGDFVDADISLRDGKLQLRRGRRMPQVLAPLRLDRFYVVGEPGQRIEFERDAKGVITGFQLLRSSAYSNWFPRATH